MNGKRFFVKDSYFCKTKNKFNQNKTVYDEFYLIF